MYFFEKQLFHLHLTLPGLNPKARDWKGCSGRKPKAILKLKSVKYLILLIILKKHEESILRKGMEKLVNDSKAFDFLRDEEELYFLEDLKEKY